ncbi:hypothetical protein OF001_U190054 [Pseudomonas sp. OF001]|nr:hypothetical protein OF001_U190054 [Pseudomonas sp. OF001]
MSLTAGGNSERISYHQGGRRNAMSIGKLKGFWLYI